MSYSFLYTAATLLGLSTQPMAIPPKIAEAVTVTPVVATPAVGPAPAAGGFTAHVASYKTEAAARTGWAQLRGRVPDLASVEPQVLPVEVQDKGTWYRLTAGRFASRDQTAGFCAALKGVVAYCNPVEVKD